MTNRYAVLGAGRQGVAAAYDLAKFGDAEQVILVDVDPSASQDGTRRINKLLKQNIAVAKQADVCNINHLIAALEGVTTIISALPYIHNLPLTEIAIKIGANMCDLGGNTEIVRKQQELDAKYSYSKPEYCDNCRLKRHIRNRKK